MPSVLLPSWLPAPPPAVPSTVRHVQDEELLLFAGLQALTLSSHSLLFSLMAAFSCL